MKLDIMKPLPDEPGESHLLRIARFNNVTSRKNLITLLKQQYPQTVNKNNNVPVLALLAQASGLSLEGYTRQHSFIPYLRSVTYVQPHLHFNHPDYLNILMHSGMRFPSKVGSYCPDCVKEDRGFWGFSYIRRTHQLHGVSWCPKHGSTLLKARSCNFSEQLPGEYDPVSLNNERIPEWQNNKIIQRYSDIACGFLEQERSLCHFEAGCKLGNRAKLLDLRVVRTGKSLWLSDLAMDLVPHDWLIAHFPAFIHKKPKKHLLNIDSACETIRSSHSAYILACALMYESAENALREFFYDALAHPISYVNKPDSPQQSDERSKPQQDIEEIRITMKPRRSVYA